MSSHSHCAFEGSVQHLAQSRMRVDHHRELSNSSPSSDSVSALLDQIGGVNADNMNTKDLFGVFVE